MNAKAVAIAKDVLEQIPNWEPNQGMYLSGNPISPRIKITNEEQFHKKIDMLAKNCQVCALGACFLSYIRLYDNIDNYYDFIHTYLDTGLRGLFADRSDLSQYLTQVFSPDELSLIESAFEMADFGSSYTKNIKLAVAFGEKYRSTKQRLIAIMKNIIKNEGKFIP